MQKIDKNYLEKFWVGLMDGDGSIQVNHWRKKFLQYRLVIKLKDTEENFQLLILIETYLGGHARRQKESIIWVENHKKKILSLLEIFQTFPPLTTRLQRQILFMTTCMSHNNVDTYLTTRKDKYILPSQEPKRSSEQIISLPYFKEWLSGFIEAEGCFCLRKNKSHSFSITQKNDSDILMAIKTYLKTGVKIRFLKNGCFSLETYNKVSLIEIIKHCQTYPLLGQKTQSFKKFCQRI